MCVCASARASNILQAITKLLNDHGEWIMIIVNVVLSEENIEKSFCLLTGRFK